MEYSCDICNYSTNGKFNYDRHLKTKKHKEKEAMVQKESVESQLNPKKNLSYDCNFCGNSYSTASNLSKHKKKCSDKKQLVDELNKDCSDIAKERDDFKKEVTHKEELITMLTAENRNLKVLLNNAGTLMDKSISTFNYVNRNYSDAPALLYLKDVTTLDEELSEDRVVNAIIEQYNNDNLPEFIGDIIIKNYKKEDPKTQSIWNSDVDRLTYMIRTLINNKNSQWQVDKKGIDTSKNIIFPILKFIEKHLRNHAKTCELGKRSDTNNRVMDIMEHLHSVTFIILSIEDGSLNNNILKYIAPRLYVVKDQQLLL